MSKGVGLGGLLSLFLCFLLSWYAKHNDFMALCILTYSILTVAVSAWHSLKDSVRHV